MAKIAKGLAAIFLLFSVAACEQGDAGQAVASHIRPEGDQLDQLSAEARKAAVGNIAYTLSIDLTGVNSFSGSVGISFDYVPNVLPDDRPLNIDFGGGSVDSIVVNGTAIEADYNGAFISLPGSVLADGANSVEIEYQHAYSNDGTGLHRFADPVDGKTYVYTYLWPYYANRLFPSFDQPDLKATYALEVLAPGDWQVVSSARESEISDDNGQARLWTFPTSEKFSTYIFSLHAGPYRVWEDTAGDIPIRLFARQSIAEFVPVEDWFTATRQGLEFYGRYFDIAYPFHKYDQLIVPDFAIGAMENVAAVTFAERYAPRGTRNSLQREALAGVILHEMAHMWFGDLVTKTWWNDLWLNESFATYMSSLALSEATQFTDAWHGFFLRSKLSAFRADTMVTTHPITVPVPSTDDFFSVFDAITYGKGASVLKQLAHFVGPDDYRAGVSNYLKKHSYSNTRLVDFVGAISESSGQDLESWSQSWLSNAGVNRIEARYFCEAGRIVNFSILQSAPDNLPTLRNQVIQVGLFSAGEAADEAADKANDVGTIAAIPVQISGAETRVDAARGLQCPDLVHPNFGDWGYAEVTLDATTLANLNGQFEAIDDPLLRSMFWHALWDMAGNGDLGLAEFLQMVEGDLPGEQNERVIQQVLGNAMAALSLLDRLGPNSDAVIGIETMMQDIIRDTPNEDVRNLTFDSLVAMARSLPMLEQLAALLEGSLVVSGIDIDQDRRWMIVRRLNSMDYPGADGLLAAEVAADGSDAGQQMAIAAEAGRSDLNIKRHWLKVLEYDDGDLPLSKQRSAISSLFPSHQTDLHAVLLDDIIAALPGLGRTRDAYFLSSYAGTLLYGVCSEASVAKLAAAMAGGGAGDPTIRKFLAEAHQRDAACLALRQTGK